MIRLTVDFSSMANADDMDNFLRRVNFVYDSIVTLAKRIAAFFIAFKRFAGIGLKSEVINVFY